jgi:predicted ATPase
MLYGYSDRAATQSLLAAALWFLGYQEQATATAAQALSRARAAGHAMMTAIAMLGSAIMNDLGADPQGTSPLADEMAAHCAEHGLANYEQWARCHQGAQAVRRGDPQRGIEVIRSAIAAAEAINARVFRPLHLGQLAVAHASLDQPEIALGLLDEAVRCAHETCERSYEPELHRLQGEILLRSGHLALAEEAMQQALTLARQQGARLWELRAARDLACNWRGQGRFVEARELLAPVYDRFTEGFELADLKSADVVLEDLIRPSPERAGSP